MKKCENCGAEAYRTESIFCAKCGAKLPEGDYEPNINICVNPDCQWHKTKFIYPDDAKFCDACGSPTAFNR